MTGRGRGRLRCAPTHAEHPKSAPALCKINKIGSFARFAAANARSAPSSSVSGPLRGLRRGCLRTLGDKRPSARAAAVRPAACESAQASNDPRCSRLSQASRWPAATWTGVAAGFAIELHRPARLRQQFLRARRAGQSVNDPPVRRAEIARHVPAVLLQLAKLIDDLKTANLLVCRNEVRGEISCHVGV